MFQRLVRLQQRGFGLAERGDIGERRDESTARHRIAANLDDGPIGEHAFGEMRRAGAHVRQASLQRPLRIALGRHQRQRMAREIGDGPADLQQRLGVIEQFRVATIPRDEPQLRIDHADALAHVLQRRFQHALVEAQIARGFADDRGDRIQVPRFAPRGIEQHARRRRPQHRREFAFDARFGARGHRAVGGRIAQDVFDERARQEPQAGIAQRARVEAAARATRQVALPGGREQGRERADEQARADRASQAAPAGQSEQALR